MKLGTGNYLDVELSNETLVDICKHKSVVELTSCFQDVTNLYFHQAPGYLKVLSCYAAAYASMCITEASVNPDVLQKIRHLIISDMRKDLGEQHG